MHFAICVGVPAAVNFTAEEKDGFITLKWTKPETNGASIIKYSVYQRFVNDKEWNKLEDITDTSKRDYDLKGEEGKEYEFVVTATNKYGESSKTEKIQKVKVLKGKYLALPQVTDGPVLLHVALFCSTRTEDFIVHS